MKWTLGSMTQQLLDLLQLTQTHHSQSPYMAFNGNPVVFADPSGAAGECYTCIDSGANGILKSPSGSFRQNDNYTSVASGFDAFNKEREETRQQNNPNHPEKIDLKNKDPNVVFDQIVAWAIYIENNRKRRNKEIIHLSDIVKYSIGEQSIFDALQNLGGATPKDDSERTIIKGKDFVVIGFFPKLLGPDKYSDNNILGVIITGQLGDSNKYRIHFKGNSGYGSNATLFYINFTGEKFYLEIKDRINNPIEPIPIDGRSKSRIFIYPDKN